MGDPDQRRLVVVGDFGDGGRQQQAVAAAIKEFAGSYPVDAMLTTGDNLYIDDRQAAWDDPFGWTAELPVWVVWGNHDIESPERRALVNQIFDDPPRYTSVAWGSATVLLLDANHPEDPAQLAWLDAQLEGVDSDLVIVAFHQPAVSCSRHGATPEVVTAWMPRFEAADVDLVLQGHDHNYQHHLVNDIDYVVSGGGGFRLYPIRTCQDGSRPLASAEEYHFLVVEQTALGLEVSAFDVDGDLLDAFAVEP